MLAQPDHTRPNLTQPDQPRWPQPVAARCEGWRGLAVVCGGCRRVWCVGCDRGLSVVRARPWLAADCVSGRTRPLDPTPETWEALRQARDFSRKFQR